MSFMALTPTDSSSGSAVTVPAAAGTNTAVTAIMSSQVAIRQQAVNIAVASEGYSAMAKQAIKAVMAEIAQLKAALVAANSRCIEAETMHQAALDIKDTTIAALQATVTAQQTQ